MQSRRAFSVLKEGAAKDPVFGSRLRKLCPNCYYNSIDPDGNPLQIFQSSGGRACPPAPDPVVTANAMFDTPARRVVEIIEKLVKSDPRWAATIATLKTYPPDKQLSEGLQLIDRILAPLYAKGGK